MIELEKAAREILSKLPEGHSERRPLEGILAIAESWSARNNGRLETPVAKEQPVEVKRFSPEAREILGKEGYVIYTLTGQSIKTMKESGREFWSTWHNNYPDFEALASMHSEVAINPEELFLPKSNNKTLAEQEKMVDKFSQDLGKKIQAVKAVIGQAPDYVALAFAHLDQTQEYLFGKKYNYDYTRTKTPTSESGVADVGHFRSGRLRVSYWSRGGVVGRLWVSPLVVPA